MKKYNTMIIVGIIIAATSQLYLNFIVDGFRVSTSVILFPVFLLVYKNMLNPIYVSIITAIMVFVLRFIIFLIQGYDFIYSFLTIYPGSVFYIIYGILFSNYLNKYTCDLSKTFFMIVACDFGSNVLEVLLRLNITFSKEDITYLAVLLLIAITRATIAIAIVIIIRNYKSLLTKQEHENRYQNLILLTSSLKGEIYFMRKNAEDIENVMSHSYQLYEKLSNENVPDDIKNLSLSITKDIHEIKKDYIRVIKGIEGTLNDKLDVTEMSIKDILYILKESTYRMLSYRGMHVYLDFTYEENFTTKSHFQLMSVLSNLVNNSIEAFNKDFKSGFVRITHVIIDDNHVFFVSDNGKGISDSNINYIFNPGFSTKFDYKTGDVYRGVGLSTVYAIVTEHFGGKISVDSTPKKGTTFKIEIPIINMEAS